MADHWKDVPHVAWCDSRFLSVCGDSHRCSCGLDAARAKDAETHAAALAAKDAEIASLSAQVQQWRDHVDRCAEIQNVADLYRRDPLAMADALWRMREEVGALRARLEQLEQRTA